MPSGAGVVVLPDVRGLAGFYRDLVLRLAEHGHAAVAIDYYGRTAGVAARDEDFHFMDHVARLSRPTIQADVAAALDHLRAPADGGCQAAFTLGFCLGGRLSWLAATAANELAGAIGFCGAPGIVGPYRDPGPTQLADRLRADPGARRLRRCRILSTERKSLAALGRVAQKTSCDSPRQRQVALPHPLRERARPGPRPRLLPC